MIVGIEHLAEKPAPVAKLKANYRYHIQLAAPRLESIQELWREGSRKLSATKEVEYQVDVDPINMR